MVARPDIITVMGITGHMFTIMEDRTIVIIIEEALMVITGTMNLLIGPTATQIGPIPMAEVVTEVEAAVGADDNYFLRQIKRWLILSPFLLTPINHGLLFFKTLT